MQNLPRFVSIPIFTLSFETCQNTQTNPFLLLYIQVNSWQTLIHNRLSVNMQRVNIKFTTTDSMRYNCNFCGQPVYVLESM